MLKRIEAHKEEQLKRIYSDKDKQLFVNYMNFYEHRTISAKNLKTFLYGFSLDFKVLDKKLKDSFFNGKAKSMNLLAYETIKQVLESEIKRAGG